MPHQAIKLKYFFYKRFIKEILVFYFSFSHFPPFSLFLARPSIYLSLANRMNGHSLSFLFYPAFPAAAWHFFFSFFPRNSFLTSVYPPFLLRAHFFFFLCRPLWRSRPTIRQRIKAACVCRYLRPTTPTRLLISSRGSKNMPLRPCMLSRARRGHRGYPFAGIATWVIHG